MNNIIIMWSGNKEEIPKGWSFCDGTNNTPDLRDKFIKGILNEEELGNIGGSSSHIHDIHYSGFSHSHSISSGGSHAHASNRLRTRDVYTEGLNASSHGHGNSGSAGSSHNHTMNTESQFPPYYKLAFLMLKSEDIITEKLEKNVIALWYGTIDKIPKGWSFCDGTNGTPDLRDKFIKCMLNDSDLGMTGGSESHTHTISGGEHTHSTSSTSISHYYYSHNRDNVGGRRSASRSNTDDWNSDTMDVNHSHQLNLAGGHSHTVTEVSNDPSYCKLVYIKKTGGSI